MSQASDSLIVQAVNGDVEALTQLLRHDGPQIERRLHIGKRWQSLIATDDVMQVTYLEAFMQIRRYQTDRGTSFAAWLERIAQNNLRDAIRGLTRQRDLQPDRRVHVPPEADSFIGLWDLLGATSSTPSREAGRHETQRMLTAAIERLPADYSAVIHLYDLEGRAIEDVAQIMGRSSGAVHMLRARAHDKLRDLLGSASQYFSTPT